MDKIIISKKDFKKLVNLSARLGKILKSISKNANIDFEEDY